ncbi:MAG: tail fiber domain-containing protein [Verrucomicrobiota bacterium]|jgi:hypothetical protein
MKTKISSCLFLMIATAMVQAQSSGTAFTYQGQLNASGSPANGSYVFFFSLYTNGAIGNEIANGSPVTIPVTNGLFVASIDFGNVFTNGTTYWLGMSVATNITGPYVPLSPRQALTPTPYAIFANSASNLTGTVPTEQLTGTISTSQLTGNFPASQLSGTVSNTQLANSSITVNPGSGLSGGGPVPLGSSTTLSNAGVLSVTGDANITASTVAGAVTLSDNSTSTSSGNTMVSRDATASFSANNITVYGTLAFPDGASITAGGSRFVYTGNGNLELGNQGSSGDSGVIRIGTQGSQTATYIAGISGVTISPSGGAVYVNGNGQLGTVNSSRRFKEAIEDMANQSDILLSLRPVAFHYKPDLDPQLTPQYGLIAEEVEKVAPQLVVRDDKGEVLSVRYEQINAMLLNEFLKEHKTVETQNTEIQGLRQSVAELKAMVEKLSGK